VAVKKIESGTGGRIDRKTTNEKYEPRSKDVGILKKENKRHSTRKFTLLVVGSPTSEKGGCGKNGWEALPGWDVGCGSLGFHFGGESWLY